MREEAEPEQGPGEMPGSVAIFHFLGGEPGQREDQQGNCGHYLDQSVAALTPQGPRYNWL